MTEDELAEAEADRAIEPYRELVPAEVLAEMRRMALVFVKTHPSMHEMLRRLVPPPVVSESGDIARDAEADSGAPGERRVEGGSKGR